MNDPLDLLEKLHVLDSRIAALRKELSALPRHVARIEQKLEAHKEELAAARRALEENEKERRRLEGETQLGRQKIDKLQSQMADAKTNDQYRAFRNEIHFATNEVRRAEDQTIDRMEKVESLTVRIAESEQKLAAEAEAVDLEVAEMKGRFKGDEDALAEALAARSELARQADAQALRIYEHAHRKLGVRALAAVSGTSCSSCFMVVRPQLLQRLRGREIVPCEFCGAVLYYPRESGPPVEDPAGESGVV